MTITIVTMLFVLPGFLSLIIVKTLMVDYGSEASTSDKILYSLAFNIPIFLVTMGVLNTNFFIQLSQPFLHDYTGFQTIEQFKELFATEINAIAILTVLVVIVASLTAFAWTLIIQGIIKLNQVFRMHKPLFYTTIWRESLVKSKESLPVKVVYLYEQPEMIEGFLYEISTSLNKDIEIKVYNTELFTLCLEEGIIDEVDYVYFNPNKRLKVIVYKTDNIHRFLNDYAEEVQQGHVHEKDLRREGEGSEKNEIQEK